MSSTEETGSGSKTEVESIAGVVVTEVKLPPFWPKKVSLWFTQIEAAFEIGRVTKDGTKYTYVVRALSPEYMEEVEDILTAPPKENRYETLKTALIKRLSDSDIKQARKLLEKAEIGDRTPAQFWRYLKNLANHKLQDDLLVEMWKSRLPVKSQQVLAALDEKNGDKLAEIADRIHEVPAESYGISAVREPQKSTSEPTTSSQVSSQLEKMQEIMLATQLMVKAVIEKSNHGGNSSRSRANSRHRRGSRSRSASRKPCDSCWYHYKFGNKCLPEKPSVYAANHDGPTKGRIFIMDRDTKVRYLVDSRADVCVFPKSCVSGRRGKSKHELYVANGSPIATYGTIAIKLNLSLRREFVWQFIVADVDVPIIGMDFMAHYNLLIDPRHRRILDGTTNLHTVGQEAHQNIMSIKAVVGDTRYHQLLAKQIKATASLPMPQVRESSRNQGATTRKSRTGT
ncbi:hypothetical protein NQ315_017318 [Exocentrus adspersus]|uniref:DUF7041 domain-containing protein n=1 Tax=Exocentrus adspersus TaxID=1586481 RepID=A0AAV8VDL8_9CUCU|nr:hypothetical protein NQ315_017318 [Exocentrus adspersus]